MSVLIYQDAHTAGVAAATLFAASVMENPHSNIGVTYDSILEPVFASLRSMLKNGLFSLQNARVYQLCEFVPKDEDAVSIRKLLDDALLSETAIDEANYVIPYREDRNWAQICSDYENNILEHGGLDLALLVLRPDGSLLYNLAGDELAPVTHVEAIGEEKVVSAGLATLMQTKKLLVAAIGKDCAASVAQTLRGAVSDKQPASYLLLHRNVTFILDEEAASSL